MSSKFPRMKDGDELTPRIFNIIFDELDRLRGMTGTGMISVDGAGGPSPPRIVDHRGSVVIPAQLTASLATGTIASPTSATVTLLGLTGTVAALTVSGGTTGLTVYNTWALSSTLASGTNIFMTSYAGRYYLLQAAC